jgi:hypothetical protein
MQDQQVLVLQALDTVEEILKACVPEAMINVRHCLAVLQTRWDEMNLLCEHKEGHLNDALNSTSKISNSKLPIPKKIYY